MNKMWIAIKMHLKDDALANRLHRDYGADKRDAMWVSEMVRKRPWGERVFFNGYSDSTKQKKLLCVVYTSDYYKVYDEDGYAVRPHTLDSVVVPVVPPPGGGGVHG